MEPPIKPSEADCCNSGCNPCILDVYESQLSKYQQFLKKHGGPQSSNSIRKNAINPTKYTPFTLVSRSQLTPTVYRLKWGYKGSPPEKVNLQYNPGQHFLVKSRDFEGEFTRAFTPISCTDLEFEIIVRIYEKGRISSIFKELKVGTVCNFRGPYGDFDVASCYNYRNVCLVAQGVGIAPIYSIITELIANEQCESFVKLLYCCRNCDEIVLRDALYSVKCHWNFTYDIFLSDMRNYNEKYGETVHKIKLNAETIANYVRTAPHLQAIICGNAQFNATISEYFQTNQCNNVFVIK